MYPLLRMKDMSGIPVILLFFSATGCFIQENFTKSGSCSRPDEIFKNNSNIYLGKVCPLEYDLPTQIKESISTIPGRKIQFGDATTPKGKSSKALDQEGVFTDVTRSKSRYYDNGRREIRDGISSRNLQQIYNQYSDNNGVRMSRERISRNHQEVRSFRQRQTRWDVNTRAEDLRTSTLRISRVRDERNSARIFSDAHNLDIRSRTTLNSRREGVERDTQPARFLGARMRMSEREESPNRFARKMGQRENHRLFERRDNMLTSRHSTERQTDMITDDSMRTFRSVANRRVRAVNERNSFRFMPSRNTLIIMDEKSVSTQRQIVERNMKPTRVLEKPTVPDQRDGRLHRFGNDRRQRENHKEFDRSENIREARLRSSRAYSKFFLQIRRQPAERSRTSPFVRHDAGIVANSSSRMRSSGQSSKNSRVFRDAMRGSLARYRAATSGTTTSNRQMSRHTSRNIRSSEFSVTKRNVEAVITRVVQDLQNNPVECDSRRNILNVRYESRNMYRAKQTRARNMPESDSSRGITFRRSETRGYEGNFKEVRTARESRVADETRTTRLVRRGSVLSYENQANVGHSQDYLRLSRNSMKVNVESARYSTGRIASQSSRKNSEFNEEFRSSLSLKNSGYKHTRQSDIGETARNSRQRLNVESTRYVRNSNYNNRHLMQSGEKINKYIPNDDQSSTGPWFGVIQISFAAIILGQLIFRDEKKNNRVFSMNKLKCS